MVCCIFDVDHPCSRNGDICISACQLVLKKSQTWLIVSAQIRIFKCIYDTASGYCFRVSVTDWRWQVQDQINSRQLQNRSNAFSLVTVMASLLSGQCACLRLTLHITLRSGTSIQIDLTLDSPSPPATKKTKAVEKSSPIYLSQASFDSPGGGFGKHTHLVHTAICH